MSELARYKKLLVFGGSFDPPHRAHVELPRLARQKLGFEAIVYIPAGRAPHKLDREQTPAHHRLAMTRLAVADDPHSHVLPIEVERGEGVPSYTVDTLEWLRAQLADDAQMRLLIGTDQMLIFDTWYKPERIIELAEPVVMVRPPQTRHTALATLPEDKCSAWQPRIVELPSLRVSSTDLRDALRQGITPPDDIPVPVAAYIREHGLYQNHI